MSQNKKIINKQIYYFVKIIVFLINSAINLFIAYLVLMCASKIVFNTKKHLSIFKFDIRRVVSESMHPKIKINDYVVIKYLSPENKKQLKTEDIVIFENQNISSNRTPNQGELIPIIHRVVENNHQNEQITTKGDHNSSSDLYPTSYGDVLAKHVMTFNVRQMILMILFFILFIWLISYIKASFLKNYHCQKKL